MAQNETGELFEFDDRPVIKGYPELRWTGKCPYRSTQYFPAQLKESYGEPTDGWMNKVFWGDNLQVMSHLLKEYRGKIDLIYIDPPFDSKADYKKVIKLKGEIIASDSSTFEEKQYGDIWNSDDYLQFMYQRLILCRELLSESGSIFLHCDWHKSHLLRFLMDEIFGPSCFVNEIIWTYKTGGIPEKVGFSKKHDTIFCYSRGVMPKWNQMYQKSYAPSLPEPHTNSGKKLGVKRDDVCELCGKGHPGQKYRTVIARDVWDDIASIFRNDQQLTNYPTQKPEALLRRIIQAATDEGDLVFDCFMGSGTTQAAAMKLGRRFIGADINLGSIQTTTKRLLTVADELGQQLGNEDKYLGFEVYNVNNYDFFRNPVEAKELLIQALDIQPFTTDNVFDGELDGRKVKILPTDRIATRADLEGLVANLPYVVYDAHKEENPSAAVDHITLVCMGHEPDLKAALEGELSEYVIDVEIVDILRDKKELEFKREAEANVVVEDGMLTIKSFYPMNLLQKLSLQKESVGDWRELVESVLVDWNYDGAVLEPAVIDIPEKNGLVAGVYDVPADAGRIKVKITDVLSESLEVEVG